MKQFILTLSIILSVFGANAQEMQGCTDSTGTNYDVGSELFINNCEYIICEGDNNWSDVIIIENCLNFECIFGACIDVGLLGQVGTYSSEEECLETCGEELIYECVLGACVDVSLLGQEGTYSSEEQCLVDCQEIKGEPSFECILGTCLDVGQLGQEGTYDSLGECEKSCQSNNKSSSYECIADMCIDVGQFGQEGSYNNLEDCQVFCEGAPASIKEISSEVLIAPNPFNSYTQIYSKKLVVHYNLFDIKGKKVKSQTINNNSFVLNRETLATGVYYLEIVSKQGHSFNKLIIK